MKDLIWFQILNCCICELIDDNKQFVVTENEYLCVPRIKFMFYRYDHESYCNYSFRLILVLNEQSHVLELRMR